PRGHRSGHTLKTGNEFVLPGGEATFEIQNDVLLSKLIETEIWTGEAELELVDGSYRLNRLEALTPELNAEASANFDVQGWLNEGFLEGMRMRITDVSNPANSIDAKIAIIRGFNASKDATMQFTLENVDEFESAAWL